MTVARLFRLRRDRRGSIMVEFALVFPLMVVLTLGIIELGLMMLMDASLELAMREAARAGSLTKVRTATERDTLIKDIIAQVVGGWVPGKANIVLATTVYPRLNTLGQPTWSDGNGNGRCDAGEGDCAPDSLRLDPGIGLAGSLVVYDVTLRRPGFTGALGLVGITELVFKRQAIVMNE